MTIKKRMKGVKLTECNNSFMRKMFLFKPFSVQYQKVILDVIMNCMKDYMCCA
jgi:hypothetical protein